MHPWDRLTIARAEKWEDDKPGVDRPESKVRGARQLEMVVRIDGKTWGSPLAPYLPQPNNAPRQTLVHFDTRYLASVAFCSRGARYPTSTKNINGLDCRHSDSSSESVITETLPLYLAVPLLGGTKHRPNGEREVHEFSFRFLR